MKSFILLLLSFSTLVSSTDISQIREQYRHASTNAEKTLKLYQELSEIDKGSDHLLVAYKGAASTLMAKYAKTVKEKKTFFKQGVALLEYAVEKAPNNVEIRYLRLSVKENAPRITGYKKNLEKDKSFILEHLSQVRNTESKKYIKGYISQSGVFDTSEKKAASDQ